MELGKLQEIDIRDVWKHEQYDFSKWLAARLVRLGIIESRDVFRRKYFERTTFFEFKRGFHKCKITLKKYFIIPRM